MNKKILIILFLASITVSSCTVIPKPEYIVNTVSSFDASTPSKYQSQQNSGFIGFLANGNGILTTNAIIRYNNLIGEYSDMVLKDTGYKLEKNSGITPINGDNSLYEIDQQHLYYFILMNQWNKQKRNK